MEEWESLPDVEPQAESWESLPDVDEQPSGGTPLNNFVEARTTTYDFDTAPTPAFDMSSPAQQQRQAENNNLRFLFETAQSQPQDVAALSIAKKFNVDTKYVNANLPKWKQAAELAEFDPEVLDPAVRQAILNNPEAAPTVITSKEPNPIIKALRAAVDWVQDLERPQSFVRSEALPVELNQSNIPEGLRLKLPESKEQSQAELDYLALQPKTAEQFAVMQDVDKRRTETERAQRDAPKQVVEVDDEKAAELRGDSIGIAIERAKEARARAEIANKSAKALFLDLRGEDTTALDSEIHDMRLAARPRAYGETGASQVVTDVIHGTVSSLGILGNVLEKGGVGAGIGFGLGAVAGAVATETPAGAWAAGVEGAALGARIGGTAGAAEASFYQEAGDTRLQLLELTTEEGQKLTKKEAATGALLIGALSAGIEVLEFKALASAFHIDAAFKKKGLAELGRLMATDKGFRRMLVAAGEAYAKGVAIEGGEEALQDLTKQVGTYVTASFKDEKLQSGPVVRWGEVVEAGAAGVVGALGLGLSGALTTIGIEQVALAESAREEGKTKALAELANDKTVQAAPEVFAEVVANVAKESGKTLDSVHVSASAIIRYFQQKGEDGETANAQVTELLGPEAAQKLMDAAAAGGKIEIPMADYLGKFGASELGKAVLRDTVTDASSLTPTELKAQGEAIEAEAQAIAEAALAKVAEETAVDQMGAQLAAGVREAGRTKREANAVAAVFRHFWETQAKDFGLSVGELFKDFSVRFAKGDPTVTPESALTQTEDVEQALRAQFDKFDDEAGAQDFYIDSVTGLLNARAWKRIEPSAETVAVISVEGVKYANDTQGGHQAGDAVYRMAARALAKHLPGLAKVGGDFAVANISQRKLNAALAAANADPALQGFTVSGAVSRATENKLRDAAATNNAAKAKAEKSGRRAERGQKPKGTKEGKLNLKADRLEKRAISPELRKLRSDMQADDAFRETYFEESTGLLTKDGRDAYLKLHPKKFHVSIDMNLLKAFNSVLGENLGDEILDGFGQLITQMGGASFVATHVSGDEYSLNGNDETEIKRFVATLERQAEGARLPLEINGESHSLKGFTFGFGIGTDIDSAEGKLTRHKEELAKQGKRGRNFEESIAIAKTRIARGVGATEESGRGNQSNGQDDVSSDAEGTNQSADFGSDRGDFGGVDTSFDVAELSQELAEDEALRAKALEKLRGKISRMRNPERKAYAEAFLAYVLGEGERPGVAPGQQVDEAMRRQVEREFGAAGFVGPEGFGYDEAGRSLERSFPKSKRSGGGPMPEGLAKQKLGDAGYFSPGLVKLLTDRKKRLKQGELGYTELPQVGAAERAFKVFLNPNADASTAIHETGHVFLEMLGELAARPDAPQRTKANYAEALLWLGVKEGEAIPVEAHEKFARGFEAFLFEGKAPSSGLRGVFRRFGLWLMSIYRSVADLDVELNDDIRNVFSRMLATDEEIQRQLEKHGQAVVDEESRLELAEATQSAQLAVLKEKDRETEAWWKEELAKETASAETAFEELPARVAQRILTGVADDVVLASEPLVLDKAYVTEVLGKRRAEGIRTAEDGVHPDEVAMLSGFKTGADMLRAVVALPSKQTWVARTAAAAMAEKYPSKLEERTHLRKLIADGLTSYTRKRILEEDAALRRKVGVGPSPAETMKRAAELMVERMRVGQLRPSQVLRAERAAAKAKARASAKGEWAAALEASRQQLLNSFLYKEVLDAQGEFEKLQNLADRLKKKDNVAKLGKASPFYRDAVAYLLGAVGLGERSEFGAELLHQTVAQMNGDAVVIGDPEWLEPMLDLSAVAPGELTVSEMRQLSDALKNISAAARARNEKLLDDKWVDHEELVAALVKEAETGLGALKLRAPQKSKEAMKVIEKVGAAYDAYNNFIVAPADLFDDLSGGNTASPWFTAFVAPLRRGRHTENRALTESADPVLKAFESMPKAVKKRMSDAVDGRKLFPNHHRDFVPSTRLELMVMAMNAGNAGNMQRLTVGRNITANEVIAAINTLTTEEIGFVNAVVESMGSLKEESFALEERTTGVRPREVQATPIQLDNGLLKGGYFPIVAEPGAVKQGDTADAGAIADFFDAGGRAIGTASGHLKQRSATRDVVISLDTSIIYRHLAKSTHDIGFREPLRSVAGLLLDPRIEKVIIERLGADAYKTMKKWLEDIGGMRGAEEGNVLERIFRFAKGNMAPALLGFVFTQPLGDLTNLPASLLMTQLKAKHLASAMAEFARHPVETYRFVRQKSAEVRTMESTIKNDFLGMQKDFKEHAVLKARRALIEKSFILVETVQKLTVTPVWLGSYRQKLLEGATEQEATIFADNALTQAFPQHSVVEQSALMRNKGVIGSLTVFHGYFNLVARADYRLRRTMRTQEFKDADLLEKVGTAGKYGAMAAGLLFVTGVLAEMAMGRGPDDGDRDDEDPENKKLQYGNWLKRKLLTAWAGKSPVLQIPASFVESVVNKRQINERGSPMFGAVAELARFALELRKEDPDEARATQMALRVLGLSTGLPTRQVGTTGGYLYELGEGERAADNPFYVLSGIIHGERDNQPDTVPRLIGDGLDAIVAPGGVVSAPP